MDLALLAHELCGEVRVAPRPAAQVDHRASLHERRHGSTKLVEVVLYLGGDVEETLASGGQNRLIRVARAGRRLRIGILHGSYLRIVFREIDVHRVPIVITLIIHAGSFLLRRKRGFLCTCAGLLASFSAYILVFDIYTCASSRLYPILVSVNSLTHMQRMIRFVAGRCLGHASRPARPKHLVSTLFAAYAAFFLFEQNLAYDEALFDSRKGANTCGLPATQSPKSNSVNADSSARV